MIALFSHRFTLPVPFITLTIFHIDSCRLYIDILTYSLIQTFLTRIDLG